MTETEKPTITPDPGNPDQVVIHFPEFGYLDTQVWSVDVGVPSSALRAAIDALPGDRQETGQNVRPGELS